MFSASPHQTPAALPLAVLSTEAIIQAVVKAAGRSPIANKDLLNLAERLEVAAMVNFGDDPSDADIEATRALFCQRMANEMRDGKPYLRAARSALYSLFP